MPYSDPEKRQEYHREYSRKWDREHPEKRRQYRLAYRQPENRTCKRCGELHIDRRYKCPSCGVAARGIRGENVTPKSSAVLFGFCQICGVMSKLCSDHDHTTNKKRGWLCGTCNTGLGMFYDNPESMRKAAQYVEKARCV